MGARSAGALGLDYKLPLLRWEQGGRSIVLSRRAILKAEAEVKAVETRRRLEVGAEFDGVVTRVQPFGAFVDIGGLEGLLHVSRMGRGHVTDPSRIVSPGQTLKVTVTKIDNVDAGKGRIALAATDLGPDPGSRPVNSSSRRCVRGHVVRNTDFGAFVNVLPVIDGLVHATELQRHADAGGRSCKSARTRRAHHARRRRQAARVPVAALGEPPPRRQRAKDARPRCRATPRPPASASRVVAGRRTAAPRARSAARGRAIAPFAAGSSLTHTMAEQLGACAASSDPTVTHPGHQHRSARVRPRRPLSGGPHALRS